MARCKNCGEPIVWAHDGGFKPMEQVALGDLHDGEKVYWMDEKNGVHKLPPEAIEAVIDADRQLFAFHLDRCAKDPWHVLEANGGRLGR